MTRYLLSGLLPLVCATAIQAWQDGPAVEKPVEVSVADHGTKAQLLGKLHKPLGSIVKVTGVVVEGPDKGFDGGSNLRVLAIDGVATQEDIQLPIRAYPFREKEVLLAKGQIHEWQGYETGGFVGHPRAVRAKTGNFFQTTEHYFRLQFVAFEERKNAELVWTPADFLNRSALLEGTARSSGGAAFIVGRDWRLLTGKDAAWPPHMEGKTVEGFGIIRKTETPGQYALENGRTRLVRLSDQLNRPVELRGILKSINNKYFLQYREFDVQIDSPETMPGFSDALWWKPVEISGILEEATLPAIRTAPFGSEKGERKYFVVRKPRCKPLDALLSLERVAD